MPTEMHWYNGGTWKKAEEMHVWDGGTNSWREAIRMYIWDGGAGSWKLCHVSPNACFTYDGDYASTMSDCSYNPYTYQFSSNCNDPFNQYGSVDCYVYAGNTCITGVGDTFVQILVSGTEYNVDCDNTSKITSMQTVTC